MRCLLTGLGLVLCLSLPGTAAGQTKFYQYYEKGLEYLDSGDLLRALDYIQSATSLEFEDKKRKRIYGTRFIKYYPHLQQGTIYYLLGEYQNARDELELSLAYVKSKEARRLLAELGEREADNAAVLAAAVAKPPEEAPLTSPTQGRRDPVSSDPLGEFDSLSKPEPVSEPESEIEPEPAGNAEGDGTSEHGLSPGGISPTIVPPVTSTWPDAPAPDKDRDDAEAEWLVEEKRLAEAERQAEEERLRAAQSLAAAENARPADAVEQAAPLAALPNGALTYDPTKVTRVGQRLAVAVLPFHQAGGGIDLTDRVTDKLVTQLVNLRRFHLLERSALDKILEEHALGMSGVVDEAKAVQAGKIAGADAIVMGSVIISPGYSKVSARVIDTESSITIVARESQTDRSSPLSIEEEVEKLAIMIYNDMPLVEGSVIQVEGENIYLDLGLNYGIRRGTKCVAYREGDPILHPATGEVLGKRVTLLSELIVVQGQEKLAIARALRDTGPGKIAVGDKFVVK